MKRCGSRLRHRRGSPAHNHAPLLHPPAQVPLPESELGPLDDLIMRMPEYCAVALLSRHAADAFVERGARISDGDAELFAAMVATSGAQLAACGGAAARLRELGLAPSLVPLVSTADGLAAAICHLGLAAGGRRLRVVCSRVDEALLRGQPRFAEIS